MAARLAPAAARDLREAMRWISADSPVAARALREAVGQAARVIGTHPRMGRERPEWAAGRYRFLVLTGFPYVVVYQAELVPPLIVRVLHGARDLPDVLAGPFGAR